MLVFLLPWLIAATALAAVAARQLDTRPPHLTIVAPPELQGAATQIERFDTAKLLRVMRLVGVHDAGPPITVMLAPESSPVAARTADWIAGFADGRAGLIVLFPARTPSYPYDSMEALLHHEVTHVLVSRAAPAAEIPRWFHEGLAMALERSWGFRDRSEFALALLGGQRTLADVERGFRGSPASVSRAYSVAGAFVRDLMSAHGQGFAAPLLATLATGVPFEEAFRRTTGVPLAEAERAFWNDGWWYRVLPLLTSSAALWLAIVGLAVYARRQRAARRRAQRQRWDDEEQAAAASPPEDDADRPLAG